MRITLDPLGVGNHLVGGVSILLMPPPGKAILVGVLSWWYGILIT